MATDAGPSRTRPLEDVYAGAVPPSADARGADRDEADTCRICRAEGTDQEPLFYPCKCSGSIKYVHQDCLMEWLSHTQKKHCELCKTSFRFTKLYHPGMPSRIPTTVFIRRAALHVVQIFMTWCRGVLVAAVWLLWLPWCMRVVWRSLFWLGDGGWSHDMFPLAADPADAPRLSLLEMERVRSAVHHAKATNTTQNLTFSKLLMSISYTPPNATTSTSFLWTFAQRWLLGFHYPFAQIAHIAHMTPFSDLNITSSNSTSAHLGSRSPSLLSDVPFFNWFHSQTMNRFIIDVLEGQIITLFVVVAFILIFLIREWVVQQQPVMNLVAMGEQAAAPRDANQEHAGPLDVLAEEEEEDEDEVEVAAGNDLVDDSEEAVEDVVEEHPAPEPTIRRVRRSSSLRRRRDESVPKTDSDNFAEPVRNTQYPGSHRDFDFDSMFSGMDFAESSHQGSSSRTTSSTEMARKGSNTPAVRPDQPVALSSEEFSGPSSSSSVFPKPDPNFSGQFQPVLEDGGAESPSSAQRPNMPQRDRSFIATEIRRSLEEGQAWSFDKVSRDPGISIQKSEDVSITWGQDDGRVWRSDQEQQPTSDHAPESGHSSESWQQVPDVVAEDDSDQALEGARSQDKGKAKAVDNIPHTADAATSTQDEPSSMSDAIQVNIEEEVEFSSIQSERGSDLPSVSSSSDENPQTPPEDLVAAAPVAPADAVDAPQDSINLILDWMFGDVAAAPQAAEEAANDEQPGRNAADAPAFAPFVENERRGNAVPPIQDPEVAAAAAAAGIDLNDQEAIDDAEDLEGILELIGMQGPIIGLFQNVLFSEVLISATLACAVWLPYLWGKVVILFMGSPISLFIKLPLQLVATMTDLIVDTTLFIVAGATYWGSQLIAILIKLCSFGKLSQAFEGPLRTVSTPAQSLAESAMDRIAKVLIESPLSPRPDYFRLSVNSHAALRRLQNSTAFALNETGNFATTVFERASADSPPRLLLNIISSTPSVIQTTITRLSEECGTFVNWLWTSKSYKITFNFDLGQHSTTAYTAMERWTATDRIIAILAGYGFFALAGAVYLKRGTPFSSSQQGQKIERIISDILQQAGGVLKVILIISIEMLAFPLYCGLLLDVATLPLFKNATLFTRWQFAQQSPWTSGFVHWFVGTCYMFHFALFVSMCRKIMRKGVLYFIRDPDDPTFHPVRDVLERSVTTQLRKIAFSALVYGALVIVCLGGVVWSLSRATSSVLPIHWTTEAPSLEFPLDLLFYNFLTPVIIKFYKPSETLHTVYKWWFKTCASFLRLSNFLFGDKVKEQEGSDGKYVRAPASDQARIPKGQPVFVVVDADNVRKDGQTEGGVHNSDLVTMVYIPSWFRVRIFAFVVTIWIFMGFSGLSVTILPLLLGRYLFSLFLPPTVEMNDIHAFSLGIYVLGSLAYSGFHVYKFISSLNRPFPDPMSTAYTVAATSSRVGLRVLRFVYVWGGLIFAIPFLFAVLIELYFLMPLHAYTGPAEPHVVHLIQDWTLGFLYSRLAARVLFANRGSRPARAFSAVVRDGYLYPNAKIATRCFMVPALAMFLVAIAVPASVAFVTSKTMYWGATPAIKNLVWRFSFPAVGLSLFIMWGSKEVVRLLVRWRLVVRDEVYLIGERLHNFGEKKAPVVNGEMASGGAGAGASVEASASSAAAAAVRDQSQGSPQAPARAQTV